MQADARHCTATNKDGSPCKARATTSNGTCTFHSPEYQAKAPKLRVLGGHAKSRARRAEKLMPSSLRPVLDRLLDALERVDEGQMPARQAEALAALAGAVCRVYELGQLEERLAAIEAQAGKPRSA